MKLKTILFSLVAFATSIGSISAGDAIGATTVAYKVEQDVSGCVDGSCSRKDLRNRRKQKRGYHKTKRRYSMTVAGCADGSCSRKKIYDYRDSKRSQTQIAGCADGSCSRKKVYDYRDSRRDQTYLAGCADGGCPREMIEDNRRRKREEREQKEKYHVVEEQEVLTV